MYRERNRIEHMIGHLKIATRYNKLARSFLDALGPSGNKSRKDDVMPLYVGLVAGEAGSVLRFVDRFAVDESAEAPTARGGVFLRVLDHDALGEGLMVGIDELYQDLVRPTGSWLMMRGSPLASAQRHGASSTVT